MSGTGGAGCAAVRGRGTPTALIRDQPLQALKGPGLCTALHAAWARRGTAPSRAPWSGWPALPHRPGRDGFQRGDGQDHDRASGRRGSVDTRGTFRARRAELTRERIRQIPDALGLPVMVKLPQRGQQHRHHQGGRLPEMQAPDLALALTTSCCSSNASKGPELTCAVLERRRQRRCRSSRSVRWGNDWKQEKQVRHRYHQYLFGTCRRRWKPRSSNWCCAPTGCSGLGPRDLDAAPH